MMYKAIHVKYLPTTNFRPCRYKAVAHDGPGGSLTRQYEFEGADKARIAVAKALAEKLEWYGQWFGGCLPDGSYAFVLGIDARHDVGPDFVIEKKS